MGTAIDFRSELIKTKFTYWKESDGKYLGYLNDYPDHWTQGEDLEDLREHLRDLFREFSSGEIPGIRKVGTVSGSRPFDCCGFAAHHC